MAGKSFSVFTGSYAIYSIPVSPTHQGLQRCRPFLWVQNGMGSRLLKQIAESRWFDLSRQISQNDHRGLQTRIFGHGLPVIGPPNLAAVKLALTDVGTVDRPHHMANDSTGF